MQICPTISPEITLSTSQNSAFQYVNSLLSDMEPFSNEETETDLDGIEGNNVSLSLL